VEESSVFHTYTIYPEDGNKLNDYTIIINIESGTVSILEVSNSPRYADYIAK